MNCKTACIVSICQDGFVNEIKWLPFLNAYRTMCFAPEPDFRRVLEDVRELRLAAEPLSAESV